jgi:iron complex transport system ATP-binding protein
MLNLENVRRTLSASRQLGPVSLTVTPGEVLVILGPNGAGKSSLLELATGQRTPEQGEITLAGRALSHFHAAELAQHRAVVEQMARLPARFTVREIVETGAYQQPRASREKLNQVLELAGITAFAERLSDSLSGGEAQRVLLARAWYQLLASDKEERYLLLDEPTAMLDIGAADTLFRDIAAFARQESIGMLAVVHDLNLALRHADRVALLHNGLCVAVGPTAEIMQTERLENIYGVRLVELTHPEIEEWRAFIPVSGAL